MPDQIYGVTWNGTERVGYTYDGFGRLENKKITVIPSSSEESQAQNGVIPSSAEESQAQNGVIPSSAEESQPIVLNNNYTYVDVAGTNKTTTLVNSVANAAGTYNYTYDAVGNITSISDGTNTTSYVYDDLNQLVRENDQKANKTFTYTYVNGNITGKYEYDYTVGELPETARNLFNFKYTDATWGDKITGVAVDFYTAPPSTYSLLSEETPTAEEILSTKSSSETSLLKQPSNGISMFSNEEDVIPILSDSIGNITSLGENSFTWENGRQLKSSSFVLNNTDVTMTYGYNAEGQRTSKTLTLDAYPDDAGLTYEYIYNGSTLAGIKWLNYSLVYMYDNNGDIFGFNLDNRDYYYIKNAQNDVIALTNSTGTIICRYSYDAWGNMTEERLSTNTDDSFAISNNHITYRSYFYDSEINMYYLNSRYYSPDMCRFLNADGYVSTGQGILSYNMFSYCQNNPINFMDETGQFLTAILSAIAGLSIVVKCCIAICIVSIALTILAQPQVRQGIETGVGNFVDSVSDSISRTKNKIKTKAKEKEAEKADVKPKEQPVIFTVNPLDFKPIGLEMKVREGSNNGQIIQWMQPGSSTVIFEWDEDLQYGSHYHALLPEWNNSHLGPHYAPGTTVPEPWRSMYFGGN